MCIGIPFYCKHHVVKSELYASVMLNERTNKKKYDERAKFSF